MTHIEKLRRIANEEVKHLNHTRRHLLEPKHNFAQRRTSSMHSLLSIEEIDFLVNNDLPLTEVYKKASSKYVKHNTEEDLQEMPE
jgi:hypothetical protein